MNKLAVFVLGFLAFSTTLFSAEPQSCLVAGVVLDQAGGTPLPGAVVRLEDLWAVTDADGRFSIDNVQKGKYLMKVTLLGYADYEIQFTVSKDIPAFRIRLKENSLALKEVVVTAKRPSDGTGTVHSIGRDALNHLQMNSVSDMAALLPGGKTTNPDLTSRGSFVVRGGGSTAGNAAFSTAVEVDGVRMGNNAGFSEMSGVDTRSISVDNIESVEVISGVPSVEYGDLGAGMVKIHTKTGRTPVNVSFSVNPRSYQASASKGFSVGNGFLNFSAEWANSTKKITSPYESYTRRGASFKYSNTFAKVLMLEAGVSGNLGGMNSENDPDAYSGEYTKVRDNALRGNAKLTWLLNRDWVTNLEFEASVNYGDNLSQVHKYNSYSSNQPAVHSEDAGYYLASSLPKTYYSDQITDSQELDFAASVKYKWVRRFSSCKSAAKVGIQWKADGNVGQGEYYQDPSLAANGYRPRPYSQYPFMHNLSAYAEEDFTFPFGLRLTAGVRMDNVFVKGSSYGNVSSFSPRFNAKWTINRKVSIHAGWGVSEKLPSFYVLYPKQEYRDIMSYGISYATGSSYVYYTQPYSVMDNPELRWQRNENSELGIEISHKGFKFSLTGYHNLTRNPYDLTTFYTPFSYVISKTQSGFQFSDNPEIKVDNQTGEVFVRNGKDEVWTAMPAKVQDRTFVKNTRPDNSAPIRRAGCELTVDFPQIRPIRTSFRLDAGYGYSDYKDDRLVEYYNTGWSHTSLADRSYQYVGIYANGGNSTAVVCGKTTHKLDANLTSITHIPEARIIITCRLELSILTRSLNKPAGSETVLWPVSYMDLDGQVHPFTEAEAANPEFSNLIITPSNDYVFKLDGYGPYASANLSITKEIGKHVSLSFFANNFTNSRPYVKSLATGVGAIFTPSFYYGLSCRIKI